VRATEFKYTGGREPTSEEVAQPMRAALGQIETGSARDVGQAVVLGLSLMPIIFGVEFAGVIFDRKGFGRERGATDKCAARFAHVIIS